MKALIISFLVLVFATCGIARWLDQSGSNQASTLPAVRGETQSQQSGNSGEAATTAADTQPREVRLGVGTVIVAELSNATSTKRAKVGDHIECTITQDMVFQGKVVIPRFAKLSGHVTEVEASTKEHRESRLGLSFDQVILKDKKVLLFRSPGVIVALAPPMRRVVETATKMQDLPVQMEKGGTSSPGGGGGYSNTGSSIVDSISNNPSIVGANVASSSGAIDGANRGVISWPGVFLLKGAPGTSVIASPKENVELVYQTQIVVRIVEPTR